MSINIAGGTGALGSRIVQSLLDQGVAPQTLIVSARNPAKAARFVELGVAVREADYTRPATLGPAFADTDVLMLIPSMDHVEPRIVQHANAMSAAVSSGVKRVVITSFGAGRTASKFLMAPYYLYAESKTRLSGIDWTILRNGMYLDPLADWAPALAAMGRLPYPVQHGRVAYICRDDLARASAAACLQDGHAGMVYELTGVEAVSMPELASALGDATGQSIEFSNVTEEEFRDICRADGLPDDLTEILVSMYRAVDNGEFQTVTGDVERLTGSPPQSVAQYLSTAVQRA